MAFRGVLTPVVCGLLAGVRPAGAQVPMSYDIRVRVYDAARLDPDVRAAALAVASTAFSAASVNLVWTDCTDMDMKACLAPVDDELIVRIFRMPAAAGDAGPRSLAALGTAARSAEAASWSLGEAYIDTAARSGVLATVYSGRVRQMAEAVGIDVPLLLGHAMAHELGHLILASNAHATRGLMRPVWSAAEMLRGSPDDWRFTADEIAAIRRRVRAGPPGRGPLASLP